MFTSETKKYIGRVPKEGGGISIEINGEITDIQPSGSPSVDIQDIAVGAILEHLYGDCSDMAWSDIVSYLRTSGIKFQIFDD